MFSKSKITERKNALFRVFDSDSTFLLGYISTLRNNVRSRAWGAAIGCSYRVERCCIVKVIST